MNDAFRQKLRVFARPGGRRQPERAPAVYAGCQICLKTGLPMHSDSESASPQKSVAFAHKECPTWVGEMMKRWDFWVIWLDFGEMFVL
jgi:hypothetical protein